MESSHFVNSVNPYVDLAKKEFADWIFFEEQAKLLCGQWREVVKSLQKPLHVEVGTGNGFHFAHYAKANPIQPLLGFEIKYKELVQTIRRSLKAECKNTWMVKADAKNFREFFAPGEVEKVMVHFPDPWPKRRHQKNRLMKASFLTDLYDHLAEPGVIEFKTDHFGYFQWATREVAQSPWSLSYYTEDLHNSYVAEDNYVTHFESIFLKKGQPIFYFELRK